MQGIVSIKQRLHDAVQCGASAACAVVEPKKRHGQEDAQLQKTVPDVQRKAVDGDV